MSKFISDMTITALITMHLACGDGQPNGQESLVQSFIRGSTYSKLALELDYVNGMLPYAANQQGMIDGLKQILDKPGGVTVTKDQILASRGADYAWTFSELQTLGEENFDLTVDSETVKMHVMFLDGHSADDSEDGKILGLAWGNRTVAMFKQTIEAACDGLVALVQDKLCELAERAVWTHEIGHVLGLVDNGLAMVEDHKDPQHGHHDSNEDCVMYWTADGASVVDVIQKRLTGGNETALGFGEKCLADIAAMREAN